VGSFAFMIHPLDTSDVSRKYSFLRYLPASWVDRILMLMPPVVASEVTGVRSSHGSAEGWLVGCPLTSEQMMRLPEEYVLKRIIATGRKAQQLGAKVLGLGAFTSVVGDAGVTVAKSLDIAVTTGNSYTIATAIDGTLAAVEFMGYDPAEISLAIVGATGAIGQVCAEIMARKVQDLTLVGRNEVRLSSLAERILRSTGASAAVSVDLDATLRRSDAVVAVSSAVDAIIEPSSLKPGAVVCDVARPRDVSRRVAEERDDVLVIEGGVVEVPGEADFHFNFGLPPGMALACMAETMLLAMEERYESFTLGRTLTVSQVDEISRLAGKHGFKISGFRSFDRQLSDAEMRDIREKAWAQREKVIAPNSMH